MSPEPQTQKLLFCNTVQAHPSLQWRPLQGGPSESFSVSTAGERQVGSHCRPRCVPVLAPLTVICQGKWVEGNQLQPPAGNATSPKGPWEITSWVSVFPPASVKPGLPLPITLSRFSEHGRFLLESSLWGGSLPPLALHCFPLIHSSKAQASPAGTRPPDPEYPPPQPPCCSHSEAPGSYQEGPDPSSV